MKKRWLLMLAGFVFCAGMAFAQGTLLAGEWATQDDVDDGGSSAITMTEVTVEGQPARRFTGTVTNKTQWPYVIAEIAPDAASKTALVNATSFSFKIRGNGKGWHFRIATSDVKDWSYHRCGFDIKAGETTTVTVPVRNIRQPDWGIPKRLNLRNVDLIDFFCETPGTFDVTIWDIRFQ